MKKLGAESAFNNSKADFTDIAIVDPYRLFISNVIHKAVIEVNEKGTEAAAASAVMMQKDCSGIGFNFETTEEFKCNRPFLFIIHETQDSGILFIGKYLKPE